MLHPLRGPRNGTGRVIGYVVHPIHLPTGPNHTRVCFAGAYYGGALFRSSKHLLCQHRCRLHAKGRGISGEWAGMPPCFESAAWMHMNTQRSGGREHGFATLRYVQCCGQTDASTHARMMQELSLSLGTHFYTLPHISLRTRPSNLGLQPCCRGGCAGGGGGASAARRHGTAVQGGWMYRSGRPAIGGAQPPARHRSTVFWQQFSISGRSLRRRSRLDHQSGGKRRPRGGAAAKSSSSRGPQQQRAAAAESRGSEERR